MGTRPRYALCKTAAQNGSSHTPQTPHGIHYAVVFTPLPERDDIRDDDLAHGSQATASDTLDTPAHQHLRHVVRNARDHRANEEEHDGQYPKSSSSKHIRKCT